jgi:hypothetical protein
MENLQKRFPCPTCKKNFEKYLSTHPLSDVKIKKGQFFKYCVDFHNYKNKQHNKEEVDIKTAEYLYYPQADTGDERCSSECGDIAEDQDEPSSPRDEIKLTRPDNNQLKLVRLSDIKNIPSVQKNTSTISTRIEEIVPPSQTYSRQHSNIVSLY